MDERPQHAYPTAPQHGDGAGAHVAPPWPGMPRPVAGAPVAGHAPHHVPAPVQQQQQLPSPFPQHHAPVHAQVHGHAAPQQPATTHPQFQYAGGFVTPGAGTGHPAPMSAHGGTIGAPMAPGAQHARMHGLPMPAGHPQHGGTGHALAHAREHTQAWAYPTPNGLQLVQPGEFAGMVVPQQRSARAARRIRWETIVPAAAVTCLLAAIGLFIHDFDRITGRDGAAVTQASAAAPVETGVADAATVEAGTAQSTQATAADVDEVLSQAGGLFDQGRFADAANLLHPLLDVTAPDERVVALHDRVDAAADRNTALLKRLSGERRTGAWSKVIVTIRQLEQLRPLSPDLKRLRSTARAQVRKARAAKAAKARAAQARASRPAASGGGAGTPPAAGGATTNTNSTTARPPASSPSAPASIPPRPDAPNPTGPQGGGAAAVGGGPTAGGGEGQDCHEHDGVMECH